MRAEQKTIGIEGVDIHGRFWKIVRRDPDGVIVEDKKRHWMKIGNERFAQMDTRKKRIKTR